MQGPTFSYTKMPLSSFKCLSMSYFCEAYSNFLVLVVLISLKQMLKGKWQPKSFQYTPMRKYSLNL